MKKELTLEQKVNGTLKAMTKRFEDELGWMQERLEELRAISELKDVEEMRRKLLGMSEFAMHDFEDLAKDSRDDWHRLFVK